VLDRKRGWIGANADCSIPYSFVASTESGTDAAIDRVQARHPEVLVIDPKQVMCNGKKCLTYIANTALYKDANHINLKAAALLGDRYLTQVGNPLHPFAAGTLVRHADGNAQIRKTEMLIK